jgi:hypothetical protein
MRPAWCIKFDLNGETKVLAYSRRYFGAGLLTNFCKLDCLIAMEKCFNKKGLSFQKE